MPLTIAQMALMSRLLDAALPLGEAERRAWLETHSAEHPDLAQHLREALLPHDAEVGAARGLPGLTFAREDHTNPASGLRAGARVGPYELIRLLGAGGMAEVWLARRVDGAFRREVALKLPAASRLRRDLEPRFARECDILASLEHPYIARLYDAGIDADGGFPYLSMEYVQGQPLTEWCDGHRLDIPARLALFGQVLEAVQYAHDKRVLHRDLKPSNILVTQSQQARLLDFGVARLLETDAADQTPLTSVYGRAFTPDYASPELLRGDPVDARSDVYSLGVVLYELLSGARPYRLQRAASMGVVGHAIATIDVSKPSTQCAPGASVARATTPERLQRLLRGDLDAITLRALAKDPVERYPSIASLAQDIRRYLQGKPVEALPRRLTDRLGKFARRHRTPVLVTSAVIAAAVAAIGYGLYGSNATLKQVAPPTAELRPAAKEPQRTAGTASLQRQSIVVLPFVDMSKSKDQEYFSDGLSEELIELLGRTPGLRVIPRTSSFYFKGRAERLDAIAAQLHVANVLEGSVRKSGTRVRITAQLIQPDTSAQLWSETYDRELRDVFKVQDEIAGAVVAALRLKLGAAQLASNPHRTANPEAHNQFLLGRKFFEQGTLPGFQRAAAAFGKAIQLDPQYADAYAEFAVAESFVADQSNDTAAQERALAAADKAVQLAPDEAEPYATRGYMRVRRTWDWNGAAADFDKALSLDASESTIQTRYATLLEALGRLPKALAATRKATELDPLSAEAWTFLSLYLIESRQLPAAHEAVGRLMEIAPESGIPISFLGVLQLLEGKGREALATFQPLNAPGYVAMAEYTLGHTKESQQALDQIIARGEPAAAYGIAEIYGWCGDKDKAFEWLDRAFQQHDSNMYDFRYDVTLASLHGDARFAGMLRKMNLPE